MTLERREVTANGRLYPVALWRPDGDESPRAGIVFLHGRAESGTDGVRQTEVGLGPALAERPERWPFAVAMPQKPAADEQWEDHAEAVRAGAALLAETCGVAPTRMVLTGCSQGGHGAWVIAAADVLRWRAVVSVCGYIDPPRGADPLDFGAPLEGAASTIRLAAALSGTPLWCFHGEADEVVPASHTRALVRALRGRSGGDAFTRRVTFYPGVGHDAWTRAYRDAALPGWLLAMVDRPAPG